jgi:hypothetical protein
MQRSEQVYETMLRDELALQESSLRELLHGIDICRGKLRDHESFLSRAMREEILVREAIESIRTKLAFVGLSDDEIDLQIRNNEAAIYNEQSCDFSSMFGENHAGAESAKTVRECRANNAILRKILEERRAKKKDSVETAD